MINFWKNADGLTRCVIEPNSQEEEHTLQAFEYFFAAHDSKQQPHFQRREGNQFTYSIWDFANAFFQHAPGNVIAEYLRPHTDVNDQMHLDAIAQADSFFHKAYVIKHDKDDRWEYWRIYSPNYSGEELTKMVPYRFRSQTRVRKMTPHQGPNISEPLKIGNLPEFTQEIRISHNYQDFNDFSLKRAAQERTLTGEDVLRSRWYKRWCHPILLFDEQPKHEAFDSIMLTENFYLDGLIHRYPRLRHDNQIISDPFSYLRTGM